MPIEAALRGAALALLATLGLREWRTGPTARYGALFSLSAAAYADQAGPASLPSWGGRKMQSITFIVPL